MADPDLHALADQIAGLDINQVAILDILVEDRRGAGTVPAHADADDPDAGGELTSELVESPSDAVEEQVKDASPVNGTAHDKKSEAAKDERDQDPEYADKCPSDCRCKCHKPVNDHQATKTPTRSDTDPAPESTPETPDSVRNAREKAEHSGESPPPRRRAPGVPSAGRKSHNLHNHKNGDKEADVAGARVQEHRSRESFQKRAGEVTNQEKVESDCDDVGDDGNDAEDEDHARGGER